MKFIFIPFAGGSQYSYHQFMQSAHKFNIRIMAVEYPGRGGRFREPLLEDVNEMVEDIFRQVKDHIHGPYCIYGHSLGAIAGYLLTHKIIAMGLRKPVHLFFSGCAGPSIPNKTPFKNLTTTASFIEKLVELGGCPDELLNNTDLLNVFEPIIRADFAVSDSYVHTPRAPFNIPLTVMIGSGEQITHEEAQAWQEETSRKIEVKTFEGNHFFILGKEEEILDLLSVRVRNSIYL